MQTAFQSLQLVVTDFLPIIPRCYLEVVVDVAAKFGTQKQELNVSLTAIGLLVSTSASFIVFSQHYRARLLLYCVCMKNRFHACVSLLFSIYFCFLRYKFVCLK